MSERLDSRLREEPSVIAGLRTILKLNSDKRVAVVGTTCTGKSTMIEQVPGARDQDKEIFPKLSKEQAEYVCRTPWTQEIGNTMTQLVREHLRTEVGRPLFGTVVLDADLIVLLKISDLLLRSRATARGVSFEDAKNMQAQIEEEVKHSGMPWIEYDISNHNKIIQDR